jgi:arylsulfatase
VYFGQGGELKAVRYGDSKVNFAGIEGNIALGKREVTKWPLIVNLRECPSTHRCTCAGTSIRCG